MTIFAKQILVIGLLTILGASFSLYSGLMPAPWKEPALEMGEIRLEDAQLLDAIWIDARSEMDYNTEHAPGAILLNDLNWDSGIETLMLTWLTEMNPMVVYCSSEQCDASKRIADKLRAALPEAEIYSLKGGWEAWKE